MNEKIEAIQALIQKARHVVVKPRRTEKRKSHLSYGNTARWICGLQKAIQTVTFDKVLVFTMAVLMGLTVWALVQFSRFGVAIRATAQDPMAAQLMGIDTKHVYRIAFGLGMGLANHSRECVSLNPMIKAARRKQKIPKLKRCHRVRR